MDALFRVGKTNRIVSLLAAAFVGQKRKVTQMDVSFNVGTTYFSELASAKYVGSRMPRRCLWQMKASASERSVPLLLP